MTGDTKTKTSNRFLKALALSVGLSSVSPSEATPNYNTPDKNITPKETTYTPNSKYTTTIKVRNDSIKFEKATKAYYTTENNGEIRIHKADITLKDFGAQSNPQNEELIIIHERQHQIDIEHKGVGKTPLSLEEDFQRTLHMETGARIAELLEVRRQYKEASTPSQQEAFYQKFENDETAKNYVKAIKDGSIDPNSSSSKDFIKEMTFIKNEAHSYMFDPNDTSYDKSLINNAIINLQNNTDYSQSNPEGLRSEIEKIYQIGGFDFNSVGTQSSKVRNNPTTEIANSLLQNGASNPKVIEFLEDGKDGIFTNHQALLKGNQLDLTGLSQAQAEEVIKTCYIAQFKKEAIYEELILGDKRNHQKDFSLPNRCYEEELAIYLDAKRETWAKNNTLSEQGDEAKFNQLMEEVKTIELDPKSWFEEVKSILNIAKDPSKKQELETALQKIEQIQGKTVSTDEFSSGIATPSKETLDKALQKHHQEREASKKFNEEYLKDNPPPPERLSDFYEKEVMDLGSSILKDELEAKQKKENQIEELRPTKNLETYTYIGDGLNIQIKTPEFKSAELQKITSPTGESIEVAVIDGKKHGAEITRNSNGEITGYKLYDHGKELDPTKHQIIIKSDTHDNLTRTAVELDGKPFGAEIITDSSGKTKASFYDQNGILIKGSNITKNYKDGEFTPHHNQEYAKHSPTSYDRQTLKQELKQQQGHLPITSDHLKQSKQFDNALKKHNTPLAPQKTSLTQSAPLSPSQLKQIDRQR